MDGIFDRDFPGFPLYQELKRLYPTEWPTSQLILDVYDFYKEGIEKKGLEFFIGTKGVNQPILQYLEGKTGIPAYPHLYHYFMQFEWLVETGKIPLEFMIIDVPPGGMEEIFIKAKETVTDIKEEIDKSIKTVGEAGKGLAKTVMWIGITGLGITAVYFTWPILAKMRKKAGAKT